MMNQDYIIVPTISFKKPYAIATKGTYEVLTYARNLTQAKLIIKLYSRLDRTSKKEVRKTDRL